MKATADSLLKYRKQIDLSIINNTHVHYCTPCYGGQVTEPFFRSWTRAHMMFTKHNIKYSMTTSANESLISRARCHMVAYFMANPKATHMMFIDADIRFDAVDILHMLQHDKDIIVGAYPKKELDWSGIKQASSSGVEAELLTKYGANYALNFKWNKTDAGEKFLKVKHGLIELKDAATGFMLIKRSVIERMISAYPDLYFNNDLNLDTEFAKWTYLFFDTMVESETKRYLSEDYSFCRRWQDIGGEVWLDPLVKLDHVGHFIFDGNINKMLYTTTLEDLDLASNK
jgi:hypothetical protein